jgi:hypothetical protein
MGPASMGPVSMGPVSMGAASMRTVLPGLRYAAALGATPQPLADNLILGYRRAGGPGHLYPAMQAVPALATAAWVADSLYESSSESLVEGELEFWLDRACAYTARVGCLMSVA